MWGVVVHLLWWCSSARIKSLITNWLLKKVSSLQAYIYIYISQCLHKFLSNESLKMICAFLKKIYKLVYMKFMSRPIWSPLYIPLIQVILAGGYGSWSYFFHFIFFSPQIIFCKSNSIRVDCWLPSFLLLSLLVIVYNKFQVFARASY
jgi:hypothetical protein